MTDVLLDAGLAALRRISAAGEPMEGDPDKLGLSPAGVAATFAGSDLEAAKVLGLLHDAAETQCSDIFQRRATLLMIFWFGWECRARTEADRG